MLRSLLVNIRLVDPNTADQIFAPVAKSKHDEFEAQLILWCVRNIPPFKKAKSANFANLVAYLGRSYTLMCAITLCTQVQELAALLK